MKIKKHFVLKSPSVYDVYSIVFVANFYYLVVF